MRGRARKERMKRERSSECEPRKGDEQQHSGETTLTKLLDGDGRLRASRRR